MCLKVGIEFLCAIRITNKMHKICPFVKKIFSLSHQIVYFKIEYFE